jgi:myo-inositol-1(or 4)-monophosphatase
MSERPDTALLEKIAVRATREAGEELLGMWRLGGSVEGVEKSQNDLVTHGDTESDSTIRRVLGESGVLAETVSEETWSGWTNGLFDRPLWVVDPLDGTSNFAHGHPYFSVSVAFSWHGEVLAGAVHAPALSQMFSAVRGGGARLEGELIRCAATTELAAALVSTGLPHRRDDLDGPMRRIALLARECRDVRRMGSPALDISWVGAGIMDAHVESLAPWDVAAACLIATEAGCRRTNLASERLPFAGDLAGTELVVAAPGVFDELMGRLAGS